MIKSFFKSGPVGGLIWTLIGLSMCIGSFKLNLGDYHNPGPGFMPFLTGVTLGLFGLVLMLSSVQKELGREKGGKVKEIFVKENVKRLLVTFSILLGYVVAFEHIGYLVASFIFFFLLFKLTSPRKWLMPLILSGSAVILSYLIFSVWLKSQLPRGILDF